MTQWLHVLYISETLRLEIKQLADMYFLTIFTKV